MKKDNTHWGDCNRQLSYIVADPKLRLPQPCLHGKAREATEAAICGSHGDSGRGSYSNLKKFGAVCWRQVFWRVLPIFCESFHLIVIIMLPVPYIENSFQMCFYFQQKQCPHTAAESSLTTHLCPYLQGDVRSLFFLWYICIYINNYAPLILLCTVMSVFPLHPFQRSLDQFLFLLDTKLVISHV